MPIVPMGDAGDPGGASPAADALSYINPRYGVLASSLIYLAILFVPQRFGKQINGEQILAFLKRVVNALGGWAVPVLLGAGLLAIGLLSLTISRRVYARAEF